MGNALLLVFVFLLALLTVILNVRRYNKPIYDLFEPTTWFIGFLFIFFFPHIFLSDFSFHYYTSFLVFIGSLSYLLGYYARSYKFLHRFNLFKYSYCQPLSTRKFLIWGVFLAGLLFLINLLKIILTGLSLKEYLLNMFLFHAQHGKSGGYVWLILINPIKYLLYLNIFRFLSNNEKFFKKLFVVGIIILLYLIAGLESSRWTYISMFFLLLPLLFFIFKRKTPYFKYYFVLIGFAILPVLLFLNIARQRGVEEAVSYSKEKGIVTLGMESLRGDTNPGKNFQYLVEYVENTGDYHYGKYLGTQFLFFIPRKVWNNKPVTSFCFEYTERVMGVDPINDGTTYTFTCFDFYAVSGISSLVLFMFLFGIFCRFIYSHFYSKKLNFYWLAFAIPFVLNILNIYRGSFQDTLAFLMLDILIIYAIYIGHKLFRVTN